jgi:hypothetical protein
MSYFLSGPDEQLPALSLSQHPFEVADLSEQVEGVALASVLADLTSAVLASFDSAAFLSLAFLGSLSNLAISTWAEEAITF